MAESLRRLFSPMPHWGAIVCRSTNPASRKWRIWRNERRSPATSAPIFRISWLSSTCRIGLASGILFSRKRKHSCGVESCSSDTRNVTPGRNDGRVSVSKPMTRCFIRNLQAGTMSRSLSTMRISPLNSMAGSAAASSLLILSVKLFVVVMPWNILTKIGNYFRKTACGAIFTSPRAVTTLF